MVPWASHLTHVGQLCRLVLEDLDEGVADALALLLRVGDAGEALEEALLGVDADDAHAHVPGEGRHDLVASPGAAGRCRRRRR
jgi:hypothetical protein